MGDQRDQAANSKPEFSQEEEVDQQSGSPDSKKAGSGGIERRAFLAGLAGVPAGFVASKLLGDGAPAAEASSAPAAHATGAPASTPVASSSRAVQKLSSRLASLSTPKLPQGVSPGDLSNEDMLRIADLVSKGVPLNARTTVANCQTGHSQSGGECKADYACWQGFVCDGGAFDDFECNSGFLCETMYHCSFSFDSSDCILVFTCQGQYIDDDGPDGGGGGGPSASLLGSDWSSGVAT